MILRHKIRTASLAALLSTLILSPAWGITIKGSDQPNIPSGQFMFVTMTIDETKTRFELTGPDFSWFAFGFDTFTMFGYSLIIQGTDGNRTAIEQNLEGAGAPGAPQAVQNISIISTTHDDANNLTKIIIERLNNTGDANDPVFSTDMENLDIIAAYDSFSSPASPNGVLSFHGSQGRGNGFIQFAVVPEPASGVLAVMLAACAGLISFRCKRR